MQEDRTLSYQSSRVIEVSELVRVSGGIWGGDNASLVPSYVIRDGKLITDSDAGIIF